MMSRILMLNESYRRLPDVASAYAGRRRRVEIDCHTWRGTGITNYLENGGTLQEAQKMVGHESLRMTQMMKYRLMKPGDNV